MSEQSAGTTGLTAVHDALRASHDRLVSVLASVDDVTRPSYDDGWTIADVASHLGSGAEIFTLILDAGVAGEPAPGIDTFRGIWDRWNATSPQDQVDNAVRTDTAFLDRLAGLSEDESARWRVDLFGGNQDLVGVVGMRLSEHAVHTWDILVAVDPSATLEADATAHILAHLDPLVDRTAKPTEEPVTVLVHTTDPERRLVLEVDGQGASLTPAGTTDTADPATTARLELSAEAFVRLVYGRLDPEHTPESVRADGVDLDVLRTVFPGL